MKIVIPVCLALVAFFGTVRAETYVMYGQQVRLNNKGDMSTNGGILEVYYEGRWGKVCPSAFWNKHAGAVVCRQLGFHAAARTSSTIPKTADSFFSSLDTQERAWVDFLSCAGDEKTIADCFYEETIEYTSNCRRDYAAVDCTVEKREVGDNDDLFKLKVRAVELLLDLLQGNKK